MSSLILVGAALLVASSGAAVLVRQGFRHGDRDSDLRVSARLETVAGHHGGRAQGGWVAVTLTNPTPGTALVGLALRRARPGERLMPAADRRTGGRHTRLSVTDQVLGAVPGGGREQLWLWADRDPRALCLVAAVGTEGRLRLHRFPLAGLARETVGRTGIAAGRPAAPTVS